MSTLKVSTISPLGTDATKTITIGSAGDTVAGAGANTPAFMAKSTSDQTFSLGAYTKATLDTVELDTHSAFANSRFTVPTGEGGKYSISIDGSLQNSAAAREKWLLIFINGVQSETLESRIRLSDNYFNGGSSFRTSATGVVNLSAGDYVEIYGLVNASSGTPQFNGGGGGQLNFAGYKVIGA